MQGPLADRVPLSQLPPKAARRRTPSEPLSTITRAIVANARAKYMRRCAHKPKPVANYRRHQWNSRTA